MLPASRGRLRLAAEYFKEWFQSVDVSPLPAVASKRTLTTAICDALIQRFTRVQLESVLPEGLHLEWARPEATPPKMPKLSAR